MGDELALARRRAPRRRYPKLYALLNGMMVATVLYLTVGLGTFAWSFLKSTGSAACGDNVVQCQSIAISVGCSAALWPSYWSAVIKKKLGQVVAAANDHARDAGPAE